MKRFFLFYFIFCFCFFSLSASGSIDSQDGFQYLAVARNIYYQHEPTAPPYEYNDNKNIHMNLSKGKDGKWYSITGLGYTLAMLPAVALSDVLHRQFESPPPIHFPLQSDFSLLLFASFTNIFFAALLAVLLFAYLLELGSSKNQALTWSFLAIIATNLFAYAKHSFAHMLYISFLVWTFYLIRRFSRTKQKLLLVASGLTYGVVVIAYNPTFILPLPALCLYYLLSTHPKFSWKSLSAIFFDLGAVLLGFIPFAWLYLWYNSVRIGNPLDSGYGVPQVRDLFGSFKILYEGIWGQLLSPGRSFFLYSPLMTLPIIFWHKLPIKKYLAEFSSFLLLALTFLYCNGIQKSGENWYTWGGESSWGPRYIAVLIPFGIIVCALLYPLLSKLQKIFVVTPILIASFWMQALGVLLPYQIKFGALQAKLQINGLEYVQADYGNFIPRFSPILTMSRQLPKRVLEFRKTIDHGPYGVRFLEGFDFPFFLGNRVAWRGMGANAYLTIGKGETHDITLEFSNTRLSPTSSYSATVRVKSNGNILGSTTIESEKWGKIHLENLTNTHFLEFEREFIGTPSAKQVIFLKDMSVNTTPVNLASLDLSLYEPLASKMSGVEYRLPNPADTDPWALWRQNSAIYESSFDLWWIRGLYYFDYPKVFYLILAFDLVGLTLAFFGLYKSFPSHTGKGIKQRERKKR